MKLGSSNRLFLGNALHCHCCAKRCYSWQHYGGVALGDVAYRDARDFLHGGEVNGGDVVGHGVCDVGGFAVRREREPRGAHATEVNAADGFQVGQRVGVERIIQAAIHHEHLLVGSDGDAVRNVRAFRHSFLTGRQSRVLHALDFLARREVDHGEAIQIGKLHENPLGRAVGILEMDMGRTPAPMSTDQASSLVAVSTTLTVLPAMDPATANFPSGVT